MIKSRLLAGFLFWSIDCFKYLKSLYFMRILHLLEKISIPRHVSTKIYDIISTFCKSHPTSQYIQFGSSLGNELLKLVSNEMPEIGLKGVNIFTNDVPSGAHALVDRGIIEFGP